MTPDAEGSNQGTGKYPLLQTLLTAKSLPDKGIWSIGDVAQIFGVRNRAIYDWISNGKPAVRGLPGRGRFLWEDVEELSNCLVAGGVTTRLQCVPTKFPRRYG